MFLLNLSLPEFLAIFSALSGVVVTLYLLSRARKRQRVATLLFWQRAMQPVPSTRRRRIQHPWSLLLQLLSLLLLLLAVAQLKLGDRESAARDHILLLDASSWSAARSTAEGTVLDVERREAKRWLRSLPASDRVMVVRAESLPSPATGMESDRATIERAIDETRSGASALDLEVAFAFADKARQLAGGSDGEIVYAGPGRTTPYGTPSDLPKGVRLLPAEASLSNAGLTGIGIRRAEDATDRWDVLVSVRNYGQTTQRVPLTLSFGGARAGTALLDIPPGASQERVFPLRTRAAGWLDARLLLRDALEEDNRALLEVPRAEPIRVDVWTDDRPAIEPLLAAHPHLQPSFRSPASYREDSDAAIAIFDRFAPSSEPKRPALYIAPPERSPFRTRTQLSSEDAVQWSSNSEITSGIRSRNLRLSNGRVFAPAEGDEIFASVGAGPVGVARPRARALAIGFHPGQGDLRFDLLTPLLMANLLRWLTPAAFGATEVHARSVGAISMPIGNQADTKGVRVLAGEKELPYTVQDGALKFFAGTPGIVRVLAPGLENVLSLSLPEVAERTWTAPASVRKGVPGMGAGLSSRDLWRWLAALGAIGLAAEWLLFARIRKPVETMPIRPEEQTMRRAS